MGAAPYIKMAFVRFFGGTKNKLGEGQTQNKFGEGQSPWLRACGRKKAAVTRQITWVTRDKLGQYRKIGSVQTNQVSRDKRGQCRQTGSVQTGSVQINRVSVHKVAQYIQIGSVQTNRVSTVKLGRHIQTGSVIKSDVIIRVVNHDIIITLIISHVYIIDISCGREVV